MGGIETWLMHVWRHHDRSHFQMDFLSHTTEPCAYDKELRAHGGRVIPCPNNVSPFQYSHNLKAILQSYGPYDIIHSHVHHFSGYILRIAQQEGVPIRITHSHTNLVGIEANAGIQRQLYSRYMKYLIKRHMTLGLAVSSQAARDLFGPNWQHSPHHRILTCGIDLTAFQAPIDRAAVRAELGLDAHDFVLGHIGRFEPPKNHAFLLEVAAEVAKREPSMRLLLVGNGSLRAQIEQKAAELGLAQRVIFTGGRSDVARILRGAVDVFVMPSLTEGLGLALIEAQAAGCPCVFADLIPNEARLVSQLLHPLALAESAASWAQRICALKGSHRNCREASQAAAQRIVEQSLFNIRAGICELEQLYLEQQASVWEKHPTFVPWPSWWPHRS